MQILIQVARGFQGLDSWSTKVPINILDLKGDPVLFQTARLKPGNIKIKPGGTGASHRIGGVNRAPVR